MSVIEIGGRFPESAFRKGPKRQNAHLEWNDNYQVKLFGDAYDATERAKKILAETRETPANRDTLRRIREILDGRLTPARVLVLQRLIEKV